jgi:hypothetical protein
MITKTRITMKMNKFFKLEDCPMQRSTEIRAPKASKQHLSIPHLVQYDVAVGILNNKMYKVDGHTRSFLWQMGHLPILQEDLDVAVWHVETLDELLYIYKTYDNKYAAETSNDIISGLFRLNDIKQSKSWKTPFSLTASLKLAHSIMHPNQSRTMESAIIDLQIPIQIINDSNIGSGRPGAGLLAAMYILVDRDGKSAIEFFKKLLSNDGKKENKRMDSIQALIETLNYLKTQKLHTEVSKNTICRYTLFAYESHLSGKMYSTNSIIKDYKTKLQLADYKD